MLWKIRHRAIGQPVFVALRTGQTADQVHYVLLHLILQTPVTCGILSPACRMQKIRLRELH